MWPDDPGESVLRVATAGRAVRPEKIHDPVGHPRPARRLTSATPRSELRATTTTIALSPLIYLVLVITGVDSGTAGLWALGWRRA
jgi:hypothetical protein